MIFHKLEEMANSKADAIIKCNRLGKIFAEHFNKCVEDYLTNNKERLHHHASEMQAWWNDVREDRLKGSNKRISDSKLIDWFFTAGRIYSDLITEEYIPQYRIFVKKLLQNKETSVFTILVEIFDTTINEDDIIDNYVYEQFDVLNEMAQIGCVDRFQIYVRTNDPGKIPHFHIWDKDTHGQKFHTCIRIDKAEYFHHTGKEDILSSKEKRLLVQFLNSNDPIDNITYWEVLVKEWDRNNSDVFIDLDTSMPDYTKL